MEIPKGKEVIYHLACNLHFQGLWSKPTSIPIQNHLWPYIHFKLRYSVESYVPMFGRFAPKCWFKCWQNRNVGIWWKSLIPIYFLFCSKLMTLQTNFFLLTYSDCEPNFIIASSKAQLPKMCQLICPTIGKFMYTCCCKSYCIIFIMLLVLYREVDGGRWFSWKWEILLVGLDAWWNDNSLWSCWDGVSIYNNNKQINKQTNKWHK